MATSRPKTYVYGSVVISLENCVIPKERLERTPSIVDGLNVDVETDLRIVGCEYIQTAGILLKLPQVAMATGQVLFQRFYFSKSFIRHDVEVYAMACLFLAAKIEENPRRIRDVINVFHHIKQRRNHRPIAPMEYLGNTYFTLKNLVIKAERRILKELGFCVHVQHPHKVVITFLQVLDCEKNQPLAQLAWNFMNDALRTNVFVRFQPATIGCACIYLSARQLKIPLPSRPPWWELFDARIEDIEAVCITLLRLYQRPKVSLKVLNAAVEQLKKSLPKKKTSESASTDANLVKSKKGSSSLTFSQPGSPFSNVSPATLSTKSRSEDIKKNGSNKTESQGPKSTKKSSKIPSNRKEIRTQKTSKRPHSPVSDNSRDASETDSDSDDSSDSDSEADSASSPEDNRKRKDKITRRDRGDRHREKHDEVRPISGRKVYKLKSDTNSNRRVRNRSRSPPRRSRSRSPHRRSRSRSRSRSRERVSKGKHGRKGDTKGLQNRNGDYKISDKYDKRSGRR